MDLFIAWDGDHIGAKVGRAALADDVEGLRRISQSIDHGNKIWESWVNSVLGELISYGGDEGRARVPADRLDELDRIREQYASAVGSTVSVGVGVKLSEADRALLAGKMQGGDRIVLYTPEVEEQLAHMQHKDEGQKLFDEYMKSEMESFGAALFKDEPEDPQPEATAPENKVNAGGGFTGAQGPQAGAAPAGPVAEGSEHSQGEAAMSMLDEMSSPEGTHAAEDFEQELHDHAQESEDEESADQEAAGKNADIRQQVVQILTQVKQMAPQLEQLRDQAPDLYTAVIGVVQALLLTAQALREGEEGQPGSEGGNEEPAGEGEAMAAKGDDGGPKVEKSEGGCKRHFPVKWGGVMRCVKCKRRHRESENVMKKSEEGPVRFVSAAFRKPDGSIVRTGSIHDLDHPDLSNVTDSDIDGLDAGFVDQDGNFHTQDEAAETLAKVRLPEVKPPATHHHLNLPVGSTKDGKVKVQHAEDGKTSWVSVRSGQVLSNDGHPVSSRNPGGR